MSRDIKRGERSELGQMLPMTNRMSPQRWEMSGPLAGVSEVGGFLRALI
jgi:hypothetical protein